MTDPSTAPAIRRLGFGDLPRVISIERRSFPAPWSLAMFMLELSKTGGIHLAAEEESELVGYLVCSRFEDVWHVMNVAVAPHRRRRGVARALIAALLERVEPAARLTLEVRISNRGAQSLYEQFGFRGAGVRPRYYSDNGEDGLIMWRTPATLRGSLDDIPAVDPRWARTGP